MDLEKNESLCNRTTLRIERIEGNESFLDTGTTADALKGFVWQKGVTLQIVKDSFPNSVN